MTLVSCSGSCIDAVVNTRVQRIHTHSPPIGIQDGHYCPGGAHRIAENESCDKNKNSNYFARNYIVSSRNELWFCLSRWMRCSRVPRRRTSACFYCFPSWETLPTFNNARVAFNWAVSSVSVHTPSERIRIKINKLCKLPDESPSARRRWRAFYNACCVVSQARFRRIKMNRSSVHSGPHAPNTKIPYCASLTLQYNVKYYNDTTVICILKMRTVWAKREYVSPIRRRFTMYELAALNINPALDRLSEKKKK